MNGEKKGPTLWIALAALGTFLGGAAAFVGMLNSTARDQTVEEVRASPEEFRPSYTQSVRCHSAASNVSHGLKNRQKSGFVTGPDLAGEIATLKEVELNAESAAYRLASGEGKSAADVIGDFAELAGLPGAVPSETELQDSIVRTLNLCAEFASDGSSKALAK